MIYLDAKTLKRIKPIIKNTSPRIITVFTSLVISVTFMSIIPLLVFTTLMLFTMILGCKIPVSFILKRYALIIPFALGAILLLPFSVDGNSVFTIFNFSASKEGIEKASFILQKITMANLLLTYLLATTSSTDIMKHLTTFGVPPLLVTIIQMMIRYFYLLVDEIQSMIKAQKARGLDLKGWIWTPRVFKRIGELMGSLFVRSHERSQKIFTSMTARGASYTPNSEKVIELNGKRKVSHMALELQNVSFFYGEYQALKDVSFQVHRGTKVTILGHNGAGKSTLISLLNGLEEPSSGKVILFDEELSKKNRALACKRVGVVYQNPDDQIFSPTVREDVSFGPRNFKLPEDEVEARVNRALASVGLKDFGDHSPFELSYGQKRRVAIAGVLAMQPEVIIMDEPMAFLDPQGQGELHALLESMHFMGMTIIIVTHDVDFAAEWSDKVLILQDGKVYADGTSEMLFDEELLKGAGLPLPKLAQPFKMLKDIPGDIKPRSVRDAAQWIWRLMVRHEQKKRLPNVQDDDIRNQNAN